MVRGLKKTYKAVMSANGQAQMLTYSFWGVLMAGMLSGVCDMCITPTMLMTWGAVSILVAYATVWMDKKWLRNILLVDTALSAWILAILVFHEPHNVDPVYYSFSVDGISSRSVSSDGHSGNINTLVVCPTYLSISSYVRATTSKEVQGGDSTTAT